MCSSIHDFFLDAKMSLVNTLKPMKDQIQFIIFQLLMYIVHIGTDVNQALDFWRFDSEPISFIKLPAKFSSLNFNSYSNGHPRRAMVTVFWITCPMLVKAITDLFQYIKLVYRKEFSCQCNFCQVSKIKRSAWISLDIKL